MERRDFLSNVSQVLTFVGVGSLLSACSKSSGSPSTATPFNVDLSTQLATVGSAYINGSIVVIRLKDGNTTDAFDALSLVCTHEGCGMTYEPDQQDLFCACHGSRFDLNGNVIAGPANKPVTKYSVAVSGSTLTVG